MCQHTNLPNQQELRPQGFGLIRFRFFAFTGSVRFDFYTFLTSSVSVSVWFFPKCRFYFSPFGSSSVLFPSLASKPASAAATGHRCASGGRIRFIIIIIIIIISGRLRAGASLSAQFRARFCRSCARHHAAT